MKKVWKAIISVAMGICLLGLLLTPANVGATDTLRVIIEAPTQVSEGVTDLMVKVALDGNVTDLDTAQFDVAYDKDVLSLTGVTSGLIGDISVPVTWGYVPGGGQLTDTGKTRVICSFGIGQGPASGTGYLAKIHFDVVGSAGSSTTISFPADATLLLGDTSANPIPVGAWVDSGTVTVSSALSGAITTKVGEVLQKEGYVDETTFTFTGAGSGGTPDYTYQWDFEYDGSAFDIDATGVEATHSYTTSDTYTVALKVIDSLPGDTEVIVTDEVTVYDTLTIDSCMVDPTEGAATCTEFTFSGTASGGKPSLTYAWNFGDGGAGAGTSPTHIYLAAPDCPGYPTYTVTFTVTDGLGTEKATNCIVDVYLLGDANGDYCTPETGGINVLDMTYVKNIILEKPGFTATPGADANCDGDVNIFDITTIKNMILPS